MSGNKVLNLQKMKENGIRVPDFCVINFEEILDVEKLPQICFREDLELCFPIADAGESRKESDVRYAVRSACSLEDSENQSFAGQFDTYLNVRREDCKEKVRQCVQSLAAEHVQAYTSREQVDNRGEHVPEKCADDYAKGQAARGEHTLRMDVILQCMVDAEVSGVLFTANPQGILNESVITVGRGLGEGVVSDRVATTTYYYNLTDRLYYYEGEEELLSPKQVEELIGTAEKIKEILNEDEITDKNATGEREGSEKEGSKKEGSKKPGGIGEYDIEFAIRGGELFILQARPITTLKADAPLILDNSNIVESYPGLSLPLTISFVNIVYGGVFRGVSARVLKNDKELDKHTDVFQNMVGHANGRVYYKISNWYTVLKFLPFHKKIIPVWQEMLGVRNKSYDGDEVELSPFVRVMTYVNSFYEMVHVPRNMKKLNEDFQQIQAEFYAKYAQYDHDEAKNPAQLLSMYQEIKTQLFDVWDVTLLNDMYAFVFTGLLKSRLKKKYGKAEQDVNRYISDISDIESMKPIRALVELAYRKDSLTLEEYEGQKAEYIQIYGDRNLEELKLESKTFRSNPELLEERIESYRRDPEKLRELYAGLHQDMYRSRHQEENRGEDAETDSKGINRRDFILRILEKHATKGIANREISRLNRSRIYGIVRLIFTSIGEWMANEGVLESTEDVFWLTVEEVFEAVRKCEGDANDRKEKVTERKEQYQIYEKLPAYSRLIFAENEFDKHPATVNAYKPRREDAFLQGVPCSNGEVTAEALVIEDIKEIKDNLLEGKDVAGKILVTKMTDPGWVFLLATAKGLISEKGSLLSHTAIISRELQIPSVVGVSGLLETVHTGDVIHMDGSTGRIEIRR